MFISATSAPQRLLSLLTAFALLPPALASAETIQFQTNVGSFDVTLNPTNNPDLQPLVDNLLLFTEAGSFDGTVINRADETLGGAEFVLQLGSFTFDASTVDAFTPGGITPIADPPGFTPVIVDSDGDDVVDFDTSGLTNEVGTVTFALSAAGPNSAGSSFFVNLNNNDFLDPQGFVPFAVVEDLTVINAIAALPTVDLSTDVGAPGSLAFTDIPVTGPADNEFVIVEQAFVLSSAVPEPSSMASLIGLAMMLPGFLRRRL